MNQKIIYRPDIDGLRAVAVLSVIGFHFFPNWLPGGFNGVDIFYVISGFLISSIIYKGISLKNFSFTNFYKSRIRRILPALLLVLSFSYLAGFFFLLSDEFKYLAKHILGGLGFFSNYLLWNESGYFDNSSNLKPLLHLWSLSIEEQFYLFWPLILWFIYKFKQNFIIVTLIFLSLSFFYMLFATWSDYVGLYYSFFARAWEIMIGCFLAFLSISGKKTSFINESYKEYFSVIGLILIVISLLSFDSLGNFPGWRTLLPTIGTAALIFSGPSTFINKKVLSNNIFVKIGIISYPLYLWHWPLFSYIHILDFEPTRQLKILCILISFILAFLTYKYLEKPIRSSAVTGKAIKIITCTTLMLIIISFLTLLNKGFPLRYVKVISGNYILAEGRKSEKVDSNFIENDLTSEKMGECLLDEKFPYNFKKICSQLSYKDAKYTVVIWGDSFANAMMPVFKKISREKKYNLIAIWHAGCPPIGGVRTASAFLNFSHNYNDCSNTSKTTNNMDNIVKLKPDLIFLISRWSGYANGFSHNGKILNRNNYLTSSDSEIATIKSSRQALKKQIPITTNYFIKNKIPVTIIQDIPLMNFSTKNLRKTIDEIEPNYLDYKSSRIYVDSIFSSLVDINFIDPSSVLCKKKCFGFIDGVPIYEDDEHLNSTGALLFEKDIVKIIEKYEKSI